MFCFGQDTSRWYAREGKRKFRAEQPATAENKAEGQGIVRWMQGAFDMHTLSLQGVQARHEAYLKGLLRPGSGHGRSEVLGRLSKSHAAAERLRGVAWLGPSAFALPGGCTDFVSTLGRAPHGTRLRMPQRPRVDPYPPGAFKGMSSQPCPHPWRTSRCSMHTTCASLCLSFAR